jgi:hypothetical protein
MLDPFPRVTFGDMAADPFPLPPPSFGETFFWPFVILSFEAWYGNQAQQEQVYFVIRCEILSQSNKFLFDFVLKTGLGSGQN